MHSIQPTSRRGARPLWILYVLSAALVSAIGCSDSTEPLLPSTIQISGDAAAFSSIGETRTFQATILDKKGGAVGGSAVSWSSSASTILEVNPSTGQVSARGNGSATLTATAAGVSASRSLTVAQVPTGFQRVSGDGQTGEAGAELPLSLVVRVNDALGNPVQGVTVNFQVTAGGGTAASNSQATNSAGDASSKWTLGSSAGDPQTLRAAVGTHTQEFTATARAGAPAAVALVSGSGQSGSVRESLAEDVVVRVTDAFDNPVPGASLSWSTPHGGQLAPSQSTTDVEGRASTRWTLGQVAGNQTATAAIGPGSAEFAATALPGPAAAVAVVSGSGQTGIVLERLVEDLVVLVADAYANPVSGVSVAWTTVHEGGELTPASSTTDANGLATTAWTPGQPVGSQTATAAISGLPSASFTATALAPPVAEVLVSPASSSIAVGGTVQLTAVARSAGGLEITGVTFDWSSANLAVATVDGTGKVSGSGAGTAIISAEASGITGTSSVTVVAAEGVTIQSVSPDPLVEGGQATITGTGFSSSAAENQVTIGGLAAPVTSAATTQLQVSVPSADCMPPRTGTLTVSKGESSASTSVTLSPENLRRLEVGQGILHQNSSSCLNLADGSAGEEYLIGVLSASEVPSSLTPAYLRSRTGIPLAPSAAMLLPEQGVSTFEMQAMPTVQQWPSTTFADLVPSQLQDTRLDRHWEAEARLRQQEQEMISSMGGLDQIRRAVLMTSPGAERVPSPVPAVGEVVDLYHDAGCDTRPSLQAAVRYVGSGGIWLEDVGNPGPAFTESELQGFDALLSSKILSTLQSHFGSFEDVDGNDRILVLITKEVNKKGGVLGYAWGGDLIPKSYCARSNQAEIFYGIAPDPDGIVGSPISKQQVLDLYPSLIAHELTHVIQQTQQIWLSAGQKSSWEMEGGATLAEKLVGHQVLGYSSRSNLGWSAVSNGFDWYWDWVGDLGNYFGWSPAGPVPGAPEQCTWTGKPEEGNAGPCYGNNRAIYGVPAWLLQFVLDYYGPSFPGGDAAAMRRMTQSGFAGFATLEDVAGESIKTILALFGSALYTDGRYGNAVASWDLFDIFSALTPTSRPQPYLSSAAEPQLDVLVRGGSTAYLHWSPGAAYNATALRVRTSTGAGLPSHMAYWIMRLK